LSQKKKKPEAMTKRSAGARPKKSYEKGKIQKYKYTKIKNLFFSRESITPTRLSAKISHPQVKRFNLMNGVNHGGSHFLPVQNFYRQINFG
jgi:hypothetical protein